MLNNCIYTSLAAVGVLPVIKLERADDALPLCEALANGGLPAAEITFRTSAATEAIENVRREMPELLCGAGTVLSVEQAKRAADAGAEFIVSPGFNQSVVSWCIKNGITVIPGCVTPTEIETAMACGLEVLKFFPSEAFGGVKTIKALSAPYRTLRFIPTGGITPDNLAEYLSCPAVLACGGSYMVKDEYINSRDFAAVTRLCEQTAQIIRGVR